MPTRTPELTLTTEKLPALTCPLDACPPEAGPRGAGHLTTLLLAVGATAAVLPSLLSSLGRALLDLLDVRVELCLVRWRQRGAEIVTLRHHQLLGLLPLRPGL